MALIIGALMPHLATPQPKVHHHSFWEKIVEAIVAVVIIVFAPHLIGVWLGLAPGLFTAMTTYAIGSALATAADQGLAIGFGAQKDFSWDSVWESAIEGGMTAGLGAQFKLAQLAEASFGTAFMLTASIIVTEQLVEMSLGLRKQIDLKSVFTHAAGMVIGAKLNSQFQNNLWAKDTIETIADAGIASVVYGKPMNLEDVAVAYVRSVAQDEATQLRDDARETERTPIKQHTQTQYQAATAANQDSYSRTIETTLGDTSRATPDDQTELSLENKTTTSRASRWNAESSSSEKKWIEIAELQRTFGADVAAVFNEVGVYDELMVGMDHIPQFTETSFPEQNYGRVATEFLHIANTVADTLDTMKVFNNWMDNSSLGRTLSRIATAPPLVLEIGFMKGIDNLAIETGNLMLSGARYINSHTGGFGVLTILDAYSKQRTGDVFSFPTFETQGVEKYGDYMFNGVLIASGIGEIPRLATFAVDVARAAKNFEGVGSLVRNVASLFGIGGKVIEGADKIGLTSRLNRSQIIDYLSSAHTIPREQLIQDLESLGLKFKGQGRGGEFMEFTDKQDRLRIKIHPPDPKTPYSHIHIYDNSGRPLSSELNIVSKRSAEAHIEVQPFDGQQNKWRSEW